MLPLENYPKMFHGIFKNLYIFKYDNNGFTIDRKHANYIEIIT